MNKTMLILLALVLVAAMAGCAPKTAEPAVASAGDAATQPRQLPLTTKLIIGTLKLEGTANEVTAEQAAELVPLWKGYLAVTKSESASRQELDGLANQIAETMTEEQMAAIDALELDGASMGELLQALGIDMSSRFSEEQRATMQAQRAASGGEGSFRPGGGGGFGGGPGGGNPGGHVENISPQQMQTVQAMRATGGGAGMGGNTVLVEKLIEILSAK